MNTFDIHILLVFLYTSDKNMENEFQKNQLIMKNRKYLGGKYLKNTKNPHFENG